MPAFSIYGADVCLVLNTMYGNNLLLAQLPLSSAHAHMKKSYIYSKLRAQQISAKITDSCVG
jgi:hypothetical protein